MWKWWLEGKTSQKIIPQIGGELMGLMVMFHAKTFKTTTTTLPETNIAHENHHFSW